MTEKEFEQLKVGDKVWIITDWFNKSNEGMKAVELEVKGKEEDEQIIQFLGVCFKAEYCSLTKSEAWEKEVKRFEEALKSQEQEVEKGRKALDRYKAELAKAREEEERGWVIINEKVYKETPYISFPSSGFQKYPTEREAYEALSEYYKGKHEEALVKSGRYSWAVGNNSETGEPKIFAAMNNGGEPKGYLEDVVRCPSRQEAEAELERRKKDDTDDK